MADTGHDTESRTQVVVLGAGTMGAGIAQCLADHGRDVTLTDVDPLALQRALERIATSRLRLEHAGLQTAAASLEGDQRLNTSTDLARSLTGADLVIEAVLSTLRNTSRQTNLSPALRIRTPGSRPVSVRI